MTTFLLVLKNENTDYATPEVDSWVVLGPPHHKKGAGGSPQLASNQLPQGKDQQVINPNDKSKTYLRRINPFYLYSSPRDDSFRNELAKKMIMKIPTPSKTISNFVFVSKRCCWDHDIRQKHPTKPPFLSRSPSPGASNPPGSAIRRQTDPKNRRWRFLKRNLYSTWV